MSCNNCDQNTQQSYPNRNNQTSCHNRSGNRMGNTQMNRSSQMNRNSTMTRSGQMNMARHNGISNVGMDKSKCSRNMDWKEDRMRDIKCKDGCDKGNAPIDKMSPGMGYIPWQEWTDIYDFDKAFQRGTIFEELDKPYIGRPIQ